MTEGFAQKALLALVGFLGLVWMGWMAWLSDKVITTSEIVVEIRGDVRVLKTSREAAATEQSNRNMRRLDQIEDDTERKTP